MSSRRHALATAAVLAAAVSPLLALACDDRRAPSEPRPPAARSAARPAGDAVEPSAEASADRLGNPLLNAGIAGALAGKLPSTDTITSGVPAFEIRQKGGGIAGRFEVTNPNSAAIALDGVNAGTGHALLAWNYGKGRGAVVITSNSLNTLPALDVSSQSVGTPAAGGTSPGLAAAMDVRANNTTTTVPAAAITTLGQNTVLRINHRGTTGDLAVFQVLGANRARINRAGKGIFNGGTQVGGADVAESFAVEGRRRDYAPGDVLVISDDTDRRVERADEAYSTRVIGVYATKPGVVLVEGRADAPRAGHVPVGVIGVLPTRVSAENGTIRRGDLLVTAATPGHAMRGTDRDRMLGAVLGKALAGFEGPGTGVIPVLVSAR
jgi:hypothetical protein